MIRVNKRFEVPDDLTIFRYMDFSKFMDLLENKKLFFCNSKYFEDEYEGKRPEGFFKAQPEGGGADKNKRNSGAADPHYGIYISCWNADKLESYALWKIFTTPGTGIAIKTKVGNLKKALSNDDIKIFKTEYIKSFHGGNENLELPLYYRYRGEGCSPLNRRIAEAYKSGCYEFENEVRAIFVDDKIQSGKSFEVDINTLIDEIYISPYSSGWFESLIEKIKNNAQYHISDKPIKKSKILLRKNGG